MTPMEKKTEAELLNMLKSSNPEIRAAAASSRHATLKVLIAALEAPDPKPFDYSLLRGGEPDSNWMSYLFSEARAEACRNENATPDLLLRAIENEEDPVSAMAACSNPKATAEVFQSGLRSQDAFVRDVAAQYAPSNVILGEILFAIRGQRSIFQGTDFLHLPTGKGASDS